MDGPQVQNDTTSKTIKGNHCKIFMSYYLIPILDKIIVTHIMCLEMNEYHSKFLAKSLSHALRILVDNWGLKLQIRRMSLRSIPIGPFLCILL